MLVFTLLGMATAAGGLVVAVPWLAHASWHAYRDLVDADSRKSLMFGYSEEQIAQFGLTFGVGAFMLYMVFIIFQLARESKAGRFGTFVLFLALGFGLVGFAAKWVIKYFIAGEESAGIGATESAPQTPRPALGLRHPGWNPLPQGARGSGAFARRASAPARYPMCRPPLQEKSAPVVKPESSPASQATIEPISSGVPSRLTGIVSTIFSSTSGLIARTMSVPM